MTDLDAGLLPALRDDPPDLVWPLLHGASGEDGSVRDVLEVLGVRYLGSLPRACRQTYDKPVAGGVVAAAGVQVPESFALPHSVFRELGAGPVLDALVARLGLPLVVKPARGGSALGVTVVDDTDRLPRAMVDCFAYDEVAMLQRAVQGVEVAVSVVDTGSGPRALPAVEIVPAGAAYDYAARYTAGATEYFAPARLSHEVAEAVAATAMTVHQSLGLRDVSRTDLIITEDGSGEAEVWFLEANVAPGMTETSLLPQAVGAADESLPDVYRAMVDVALSRA